MNQPLDSKKQPPEIEPMRPYALPHFGQWLVVLIVILNLAVVGFGVFNLQNSRDHYQQLAETETRNLTQAIDQSVSSFVEKINLSLRTVAYEYERHLASGAVNHTLIRGLVLQQKKYLPEAISVRIIDAEGNLVFGSDDVPAPPPNIADREYFRYLKAHPRGEVIVSKPLLSRFTNQWVIVFAQRIDKPDGSLAGVVIIPVLVDYFDNLLSKYNVGDNGALYLRDANLGLILRRPAAFPDKEVEIRNAKPAQKLRELVSAGLTDAHYHAVSTNDHIQRAYSFRKISYAPMYTVVGLAESDYLVRWHHEMWETVAFLLTFVLATCLSGVLISRIWRRQLRDTVALHQSHQQLEATIEELADRDRALVATQEAGRLGTYSLSFVTGNFTSSVELDKIFGIDQAAPRSVESWLGLIHPADRDRMQEYFKNEVVAKKQAFNQEYRIVAPLDGSTRWVQGFGALEFDDAGNPIRMSGAIIDISDRKRSDEQLLLAHEVFLNTREATIVTDENSKIIDINPAFSEVSGYCREDVIGKTPRMLQSGRQDEQYYKKLWKSLLDMGYWEGEFQNRRKDGQIYIQATKISAVRNDTGQIIRFIAVASDVTQLRAHQHQIEHLAYHDKLTDLPNRVMLADRLKLAIAQAERRKELLGVCYLDLDGFKEINDSWGHDVGDRVLVEIADRLKQNIRAGDTVARLGGDEFIVLLGNVQHIGEIEQAIQRMLSAIAMPFQIENNDAQLTASIGVSIYPDDIEDADMLIRRADQAMYVAKRSGKNQFHLFDSVADRKMRAEHDLSLRLVMALENDEFHLYYQPKVDMPTGKVVGAEALIRWQHPDRGVLPPAEFLPVIENTVFSIKLGEWVITQALRQMAKWSEAGMDMPVSVNISGYHLQRPDFVERLSSLMAEFPTVNHQWLQLEILETTAVEDVDLVSSIIASCAELGVSFALDDFGTGYSTLTYFRRLPTDLLKIDRSFICDMLDDVEDFALVESIIKLAHSFQRKVIAEGVETVEHGLSLMQLGCNLAQGYGIAHPMPADAMPQWVNNWVVPIAWREAGQVLSVS